MGSKKNQQIAVIAYFETADLSQARDTFALVRATLRRREKGITDAREKAQGIGGVPDDELGLFPVPSPVGSSR